jgi:MoaA/NifB/PqqE/SkfB family radical SAM enzyme
MEKKAYAARVPIDRSKIWADRGPLLRALNIELTERCNNHCIHCYINRPKNAPGARDKELAAGDIKDVIREAVSLGCLTVKFTGGEPLLREDFEDLYIFSRRAGLRVVVFTNATLITPRLGRTFSRIPPLERIEVSLYGMKKGSYEAVSGVPGSHDAARRGIDILVHNNVPFIVKSTALPPNREEIAEMDAWAATIPWMDSVPSWITSLDLRARRDSEERNGAIRALRLDPASQFRIMARKGSRYIEEMKVFFARFAGPPGPRLFSCNAGLGSACLDSYGTIQACLLLRHPGTVLPLKQGGLRTALTKFFPRMRDMAAVGSEYLRRCGRCFLNGFCEQCPGKSWMEHGTLDTPVDPCCEAAHFGAREMGLLRDGEDAWEVRDWEERIKTFTKGGR